MSISDARYASLTMPRVWRASSVLSSVGERRAVLEAQKQLIGLRLLYLHQQGAADLAVVGPHVVAHRLVGRERDTIAHHDVAEMQFAFERGTGAIEDFAALEADHEQLRLLRAQHETFPQLCAGQRLHGGRIRIVDLNEMFKVQGSGPGKMDRGEMELDL